MRSTVKSVMTDAGRISYQRAGHGDPLVLVHGGWSDGREWRIQLERLSDTFDVVAWDAPGCGGSFDPPDSYRIDDYADALAAFIRALDLDRPDVLGLSFGSSVVLAFQDRHPTVARSLILVGAYAGWAGSLPPEVVTARLERALAEVALPHTESLATAPNYLPSFFARPMPEAVIDEMLAIMADARPAGIRPSVLALAQADLREGLARIGVPVLLLHGELDARCSLDIAEESPMLGIPTSMLVVVPGAGHILNIEAPQAFDTEVRRDLASVSSRSRT